MVAHVKHEILFAPSFHDLSAEDKTQAHKIVEMLAKAMDRYYEGDPFCFEEIYSEESFTYIDSGTKRRMNSVNEMNDFFHLIKGKIIAKEYRMEDVAVQFAGNAAVVTFQMFVEAIGIDFEWNVSEVFQRMDLGDWKVIHSHYSFMRPMFWTPEILDTVRMARAAIDALES